MIKLKCESCGSPLETPEATVKKVGETVIVTRGNTFKCTHCGAEYIPGDEIGLYPDGGNLTAVVHGGGAIAQGPGAVAAGAGGVAIGGEGRGTVVISRCLQVGGGRISVVIDD